MSSRLPRPAGSSEDAKAGDNIYNRLRDLIVRGRLAPGSRLVEAHLAERLGVSRTPVRAALLKLQQEGYVVPPDSGRQSRMTVAPLTKQDARELYWIVGEVESLAARWAAELDDNARRELVHTLHLLNREFQEAGAAPDPDPNHLFELDAAFHRCYVEASAGPRLRMLHDSLKPQTERYWRLYTSALVGRREDSTTEHDEIIRAIEHSEPDAAAGAVQLNWRNGADRLARVIDTLGERGSW